MAVDRLRAAGYVDDGASRALARVALAGRGYGDDVIRFELERDGVAAEEIEAALASLAPERERALALVGRAKVPGAAIRRLAAKGFSAESIEAALAAVGLDSGRD